MVNCYLSRDFIMCNRQMQYNWVWNNNIIWHGCTRLNWWSTTLLISAKDIWLSLIISAPGLTRDSSTRLEISEGWQTSSTAFESSISLLGTILSCRLSKKHWKSKCLYSSHLNYCSQEGTVIIMSISRTFRTLLLGFGTDDPLKVKSIFRAKLKVSLTESKPQELLILARLMLDLKSEINLVMVLKWCSLTSWRQVRSSNLAM